MALHPEVALAREGADTSLAIDAFSSVAAARAAPTERRRGALPRYGERRHADSVGACPLVGVPTDSQIREIGAVLGLVLRHGGARGDRQAPRADEGRGKSTSHLGCSTATASRPNRCEKSERGEPRTAR